MTTATARRLVLPPGQLAAVCRDLGLTLPPAFAADPVPTSCDVAAIDSNLTVVCAPELSVLVSCTLGTEAALGIVGELGGGLIRYPGSDIEVSAWPAVRLGSELARGVPPLPSGERPTLHAPLREIVDLPFLRAAVRGILRTTVVAPPEILGVVVWLATDAGWLALEPAGMRGRDRWATVHPVESADLGAAVAPYVAMAAS